MNVARLKIYSLLRSSYSPGRALELCGKLACLTNELEDLEDLWSRNGLGQRIAAASDRVNLRANSENFSRQAKHPISGQPQVLEAGERELQLEDIPETIIEETDPEKVYWWLWRFAPEIPVRTQPQILLTPAHNVIPDCPIHSYSSTVSALVGALAEGQAQSKRPYLLLFTFSPVQEFIKASRKFLDFWAGSYLLHYLGARLCWEIAQQYGPDAVITPSLWSQEIIDALLQQKYPDFAEYFRDYTGDDPVSRFDKRDSVSLSTAGFPNVVTALVPGEKAAQELGQCLTKTLNKIWFENGVLVRETIKTEVMKTVEKWEQLWQDIGSDFESPEQYQQELKQWQRDCSWEWRCLWEAQLKNTWETYWTAIPLGHPKYDLEITSQDDHQNWQQAQFRLSQTRQKIPTEAETMFYETANVGTWWGSFQQRLGQSIQAIKNTRTWSIPPAPGERSTLSGQFSAVHPRLLYSEKFQEGGGLPLGSLRLFWRVMAIAFPGLFNGSERLNAIELTKRMAWVYGDVAKSLGISESLKAVNDTEPEVDADDSEREDQEREYQPIKFESYIRFPNLSAIASARFAYQHPEKLEAYWHKLWHKLQQAEEDGQKIFSRSHKKAFRQKTKQPFQIPETDKRIKGRTERDYNGVMFSNRWLADDLGLQDDKERRALGEAIAQTYQECGFGSAKPSDWWVIVVGDGDGMGQYVSGRTLKNYREYINEEVITDEIKSHKHYPGLLKTRKRMGPATHVGLNRALLDFSNRLVPYLAEKRCCGRVIYSGGDDVLAVLPLEDLALFLRSLRVCWSGGEDPLSEFAEQGGYWFPTEKVSQNDLVRRPYFTMGEGATMSLGIVIAHQSIPLPTVLETLWEAEKDRAKKLTGASATGQAEAIPPKDGLCFRVIYSSGNVLEALMKGHLLENWCEMLENPLSKQNLSSLLYRLAEELPRRCAVTAETHLFREAAKVVISRRDESEKFAEVTPQLLNWLDAWERWAYRTNPHQDQSVLGAQPENLGYLLRFTAFLCDRLGEREQWNEEFKQ